MPINQDFVSLGLITLLTIIATVQSKSLSLLSQDQVYLSHYDHLLTSARNSSNGGVLSENGSKNFFDINMSNKMEKEGTFNSMSLQDYDFDYGSHSERYSIVRSWKKMSLTYTILNFPSYLKEKDVNSEFAKAFGAWSDHTDLTFTQVKTQPADIKIKFVDKNHVCISSFESNTLAHSFYPEKSELHFNDGKTFTIGSTSTGYNLFQVATHELGHALGLNHTDVPADVMYPLHENKKNFALTADDIAGIQALYGKKLCKDAKIDTIFKTAKDELYIFKGRLSYKISGNAVAKGYPQFISTEWPQLPSDIDAAFTYSDGQTYFFKGDKYWRYTNYKLNSGFPKPIRADFHNVPNNFDTALFRSTENKIHFFKGNNVWSYNPKTKKTLQISYKYSKSLLDRFLPNNNLDAAIEYDNDKIYFFQGVKYIKYRPVSKQINTGVSDTSTGRKWFGCAL